LEKLYILFLRVLIAFNKPGLTEFLNLVLGGLYTPSHQVENNRDNDGRM